MTRDTPPPSPETCARQRGDSPPPRADRAARSAAALRANLARRKAQARARAADTDPATDDGTVPRTSSGDDEARSCR